jgi:predicted amidohydrolase YtcJ
LPGFIDSHYHLLSGSLQLGNAQLKGVDSYEEMAEILKTFAAERPTEPGLRGRGLRYNLGPNQQSLTRHHLDAIEADRPLLLMAYDGHTAWANTEALRRANLLSEGEAVGLNSEIVRDEAGLATGELREPGAFNPIRALIPPPADHQKRALLQQGLAQAAQFGVTSIHNMDGDMAQLALYAALEDVGELTLDLLSLQYHPRNAGFCAGRGSDHAAGFSKWDGPQRLCEVFYGWGDRDLYRLAGR